MTFKIFWAIDAVASLIILYFFFVGLADGTVSSGNAGLWMAIVLALAVIMGGSIWLKINGYNLQAFGLLLILFLPSIFFLLYLLIVLFGDGRMN